MEFNFEDYELSNIFDSGFAAEISKFYSREIVNQSHYELQAYFQNIDSYMNVCKQGKTTADKIQAELSNYKNCRYSIEQLLLEKAESIKELKGVILRLAELNQQRTNLTAVLDNLEDTISTKKANTSKIRKEIADLSREYTSYNNSYLKTV